MEDVKWYEDLKWYEHEGCKPKKILSRSKDEFYSRIFRWDLNANKLRKFLENKSTKDITARFVVNGVEFKCLLVNKSEPNSDKISTYFQLKVMKLPKYAQAIRCFMKVQLNNSKIAFSKTSTRGRSSYQSVTRGCNKSNTYKYSIQTGENEYYLCNHHTDWQNFFDFPQFHKSRYLNAYFSAIKAGYHCFWCIPSNNKSATTYVCFLLAKIEKNKSILDEALQIAHTIAFNYGEIEIDYTQIREWIIEPNKCEHPLAKNGRWKSKGYIMNCKKYKLAHKIYLQLKHFITNKFKQHHTTMICRLVLHEFGDAFMKVQLYNDQKRHFNFKGIKKLKNKPQGPKYNYAAIENKYPTMNGMANNYNYVSYNEFCFDNGRSLPETQLITLNCTVQILEIQQKPPLPVLYPIRVTMYKSCKYNWIIDGKLFTSFKTLMNNQQFFSPNFGNGNWVLMIVPKRNYGNIVPTGWVLTFRLLKLPSKVTRIMAKFILKAKMFTRNIYTTHSQFTGDKIFSYNLMEFKSKIGPGIENADYLKFTVQLNILKVFDSNGSIKRCYWKKFEIY